MDKRSQYFVSDIEKTFLIDISKADDIDFSKTKLLMHGFIKTKDERTASIKITAKDDKYTMFIREKNNDNESAIVIPLTSIIGTKLLLSCADQDNILIEDHIIYKDDINKLNWIIHRYYDNNDGLILATVRYNMVFNISNDLLPKWIKKDVSDDERYRDYNLAFDPYSTWKHF